MPELPEVEIIRRQLEEKTVGRTVADVWWDRERMLLPSPGEFAGRVVGVGIEKVERRGKYLFFGLEGADIIEAHLKDEREIVLAG